MENLPASCQEDNFEDIYNFNFINNEKFMVGWRKVQSVTSKEKLIESLIKAQTFFFSREVRPVTFQEYWVWLKESEKLIQDLDSFKADEKTSPDATVSAIDVVESNNVTESSISKSDGMSYTDNVDDDSSSKRTNTDFKQAKCFTMSETGNNVEYTSDRDTSNTSDPNTVNTSDGDSVNASGGDSLNTSDHNSVNTSDGNTLNTSDGDTVNTSDNVSMNTSDGDSLNTSDGQTVNTSVKHPTNFIELIEMIQAGIKLPDTDDLDIQPLNIDPSPCDSERPKKPWEVC